MNNFLGIEDFGRLAELNPQSVNLIPYGYENLGEISHLKDHPYILDRLIRLSESKSLKPFIRDAYAGKAQGGFSWEETPEGSYYWQVILIERHPSSFYWFWIKEGAWVRPRSRMGNRLAFVQITAKEEDTLYCSDAKGNALGHMEVSDVEAIRIDGRAVIIPTNTLRFYSII